MMKRMLEAASAKLHALFESDAANGEVAAVAQEEIDGVAQEEIVRLLALRHQDPHSILGIHPTDRGMVVRAYRPNADAVFLLIDDGERRPLVRHESGLFTLLLEDRRQVFKYRLEVHYPHGVFIIRQPYAYMPTLGSFDIHLWS